MKRQPRALITGGTDGIGRASAIALARQGFSVDVVGRNVARSEETIAALQEANPEGTHTFYFVDLEYNDASLEFLRTYSANTDALDVLVLNANTYSSKVVLGASGIDRTFQVGAVSRFVFSVLLEPLMRRAPAPRVIHIAGMHKQVARKANAIRYDQLARPRYGTMASTWQSFGASGLMLHHLQRKLQSPVIHEVFDPGVVATRQVTERGWLMRTLVYAFSTVRQPQEVGDALARHVVETPAKVSGKHYLIGEERPELASLKQATQAFERFASYCVDIAGIDREYNALVKAGHAQQP